MASRGGGGLGMRREAARLQPGDGQQVVDAPVQAAVEEGEPHVAAEKPQLAREGTRELRVGRWLRQREVVGPDAGLPLDDEAHRGQPVGQRFRDVRGFAAGPLHGEVR